MRALVIIDVQNDFMPSGALPVPNGDVIVPVINRLMPQFDLVVATQDWHPAQHQSFAKNHGDAKPFIQVLLQGLTQTLWPEHCVQGTSGAAFHPRLQTDLIEVIVRKGMDVGIDSYSAFYDNGHFKSTGLAGLLREKKIEELYFCGLCSDICVYYSIKDALDLNFKCTLIEDASCALDEAEFAHIKAELIGCGVEFIASHQLSLQ